MSGLIKDSWILLAFSAFNLLQYVLVEVYGKKSDLRLYVLQLEREECFFNLDLKSLMSSLFLKNHISLQKVL